MGAQEPECELGADAAHSWGSEGRAGAEPSLLLRVLRDRPLERRVLPVLPSHQQHGVSQEAGLAL